MERLCSVTVMEMHWKDELALNFDILGPEFKPGALFGIAAVKNEGNKNAAGYGSSSKLDQDGIDHGRGSAAKDAKSCGHRYIFAAKDLARDTKLRNPDVEIYIAKQIADAFGFKRGGQVLLTPVSSCCVLGTRNTNMRRLTMITPRLRLLTWSCPSKSNIFHVQICGV